MPVEEGLEGEGGRQPVPVPVPVEEQGPPNAVSSEHDHAGREKSS